ncbi:LuxR C-terminal-related transcriptional regulator [Streptomyces sp. L2]|uniref:LuxR C-terminal-related transcriptional regulator n=1 Tax=Streptomyces sp. L2 TaxID=2162665 RepID=UPI00101115C0|nr:LuxR C-terminal-related transcriptional regulator [Streptomyces sp. L2]
MLQTLGLDAMAELVYRAMIRHPQETVADLARRLDVSQQDVGEALDRLSSLALVSTATDPSGFRAVSASLGMELLLARQQAELLAQQQRIEASRAAAAQLIAECSDGGTGTRSSVGEEIRGIADIRLKLEELGAGAMDEVLTLAPGGAHSAADLEASRGPNSELLARGVKIRTIYLDSVRNDPQTLAHIQWLSDRGAHVRTVAALPVRLILIDHRVAVLPTSATDAALGAVVLRGQGTVTALNALFESIWNGAGPLAEPGRRDARGLTAQEAETLRLLSQGLTDEAIAHRLGVSPRTTRRIVSGLMQQLNARSRFEAGSRAVQDGWIPLAR